MTITSLEFSRDQSISLR